VDVDVGVVAAAVGVETVSEDAVAAAGVVASAADAKNLAHSNDELYSPPWMMCCTQHPRKHDGQDVGRCPQPILSKLEQTAKH
jgi:hypothetical protein